MIPITLTNCHNNGFKTKVNEDLEEGEIYEEIDTEHFESTEQNTKIRVTNDNLLIESLKEKHSEPPLEVRSHDMFHQKTIHDPLPTTSKFNNSRPGQNWTARNKRTIIKQDVEDQIDNDKLWYKKSRFDDGDQNGLFNREIHYDTPIEPMEAGNYEEMSNSSGNNNPNISNFESFPQKFENEEEFCSFKKCNSRERKLYGFNMDRSSRSKNINQWMITGSDMKNEQSHFRKKICKYFLRGKCLKEDNCTYAHKKPNDHQMKLCKYYLSSYCIKDNKCPFMHSDFPCKYYHTGVKCYSGKNCRLSHAKIDDDKKNIFQKLFGQLCDNPEYIQNKYEETQIHLTKNNDIKIPSIIEKQIPILPKSKSTEKSSDEYLKDNHNNNNIHTPMLQIPTQEEPVVDNTLKYQKYEYNDKNKTGKQENQYREEQNKERQKETNEEKNRPYIDELFMQNIFHPSFDDLYDDNEGNDLVIDEGKSENDDNSQFELLPDKQKQLFNRIQSHQKKYNEIDMSEDSFTQEKHYSSDISEYSVSNSMNNALNILQNEKELSPQWSSPKSNSSKVEDVHRYEANSHVLAKLPSIKPLVNISTIEIQPYPLEMPNDFEITIQDEINSVKEFPISPKYRYSCAIELGKEDIDLRQLTYTFPITTATEINASIDNHLPMKYHMIPIEVPVLDYSKITPMIRIDDPRHRHGIKAARNLTFIQNSPAIVSATTVRSSVTPQEIVSRDPRKQHTDINTFTSAIHAPLLQTPYPYQSSTDIDMRCILPQIMAMTNNPSREPMIFGEPSNAI